MSTKERLALIRKGRGVVDHFHARHLPYGTKPERLFEFAALIAVLRRIQAAYGGYPPARGRVVPGYSGRFAGAPGERENYNHIRIAGFEVYFGVNFEGRSGARHAPDVVVAVPNPGGQPIPVLVVECKHYASKAVPRPLTNAFAGVLMDLDRPSLHDSTQNDVVEGQRFADRKALRNLAAHAKLGDLLDAMTEAGRSILETSCSSVPPEHDKIGALFGFVIHDQRHPERLVR